jgi:hypothetical protein
MKLILNIFKQVAGLKLNFHRSEFLSLGMKKIVRYNIRIYLDVNLVHSLLNTSAS